METPSIGISNAAMTFNGPQIENTQLFPTTLPSTDQQENIQASEMSLQLGQPYELRADQEITQAPQLTQNVVESLPCHAPLTQTDQLDIIHPQCAEQNSQENIESQTKSQENPLNDVDSQGIQQLEQENKAQDQQHPQSHTSQDLQPVFKISSITSAAALDVTPQVSNNPLSNKNDDDQEILKDNQEETAIIEGVVEQAKELNLEAQPVTAELPQNMHDNEMEVDDDNYDNEEDDEDEEEEEEDDVNEDENELNDGNNVNDDDSSTLCNNNLEERQNYQNQEVLTQIRPAALALHPYLEDISSSSNSLLSNSLSQTPPPTVTSLSISSQPACSTTATSASAERRLLNTEETENILNESSDALSRRSSIVAATSAAATVGQPLTPSHLAQQLPPHMPTFNFDNINEIAENNNNANIEREQLQDGQHHYHQQQLQQQNQQQTRNTQ
ncbi:hypothetical protein CVS40_9938 [Lucilia cuprina]|nr:hypothetical protein CVS40_9938 [Lucilia cuprina]